MTASATTSHARLGVDAVAKWWTSGSGLRPVSFEVAAGELAVVRGRSGSGKSTLLAIVAGWCPPDAGTVRIDGQEMSGSALARTSWQRVAVVPQVLALVPELTLSENLEVAVAGRSRREQRSLACTVLERLDLSVLADRFPSEVSMGQQQRAAVARAVVAAPAVVLADEPTSHQDPEHASLVIAALLACAAGGSAVLVASHDEQVSRAASLTVELQL